MGRCMLSMRLTPGSDHGVVRSEIEKSSFVTSALGHGLLAIDYSVDAAEPERATLMLTMTDVESARHVCALHDRLSQEVGQVQASDEARVMIDPRRLGN